MLRRLILFVMRITPMDARRRLKSIPFVQRFYERFSWRLIGKEGDVIEVAGGPLRGVKLVVGPPISHAQLSGTYERDVAEALDRLVQPRSVCYDLGASTGYHSLLMARKARQVFAFEPTPHGARWIEAYARANGFTNIEIVPEVVSDCPKSVVFSMTGLTYGSRVVAAADNDPRWAHVERRTITLDQFAESHPQPDLVKIDIEGEEGNALRGAERLLRVRRPIICCEIHDLENARAVAEILTRHSYRICALDGSPFEMPRSIHPGDFHVLCLPD
jgi:FkbM family methyltransferase